MTNDYDYDVNVKEKGWSPISWKAIIGWVVSGKGGKLFAWWLVLKSAYLSRFYIIILHLKYQ